MEMKRELYSNSLKEPDASPTQKGKSSMFIKVIVPRNTRTSQIQKEKSEVVDRVNSITTTYKRKLTLEGEVAQKESLINKTPKDVKGKIEYNPVSKISSVSNVENPFSPGRGIATKGKTSPQKQGRFAIFSKPKAPPPKPVKKRASNLKRKELRDKQAKEKDILGSDTEEPTTGYNKHLISYGYDETK